MINDASRRTWPGRRRAPCSDGSKSRNFQPFYLIFRLNFYYFLTNSKIKWVFIDFPTNLIICLFSVEFRILEEKSPTWSRCRSTRRNSSTTILPTFSAASFRTVSKQVSSFSSFLIIFGRNNFSPSIIHETTLKLSFPQRVSNSIFSRFLCVSNFGCIFILFILFIICVLLWNR